MKNKGSPRLHKNLVAGVVQALEATFGQKVYADRALERLFKANKQWGARDRAFVAEHSYEIVRHWRLLWYEIEQEPQVKRKALYTLVGWHLRKQGYPLPDWPGLAAAAVLSASRPLLEQKLPLALQLSFPDWLFHRCEEELGEAWPAIAQELNREAHLIIRVNRLKAELEQVEAAFGESTTMQVQRIDQAPDALLVQPKGHTFKMEAFQQGWFEVQDAGSQRIAPFVEVEPGMRVIDACAGAGGKTLHLAALMQNKGQIIAMDVQEHKLAELQKRARRSGVWNVEVRTIDSTKVIKRLAQSADRLLLDVPCTGTGVIKRNPDTKWKLQPKHLERTQKMQGDILRDYSSMLKPGGKLCYATCSILRSENEAQVGHFLATQPDFHLISEQRIDPSPHNDGFYMALIGRKNRASSSL